MIFTGNLDLVSYRAALRFIFSYCKVFVCFSRQCFSNQNLQTPKVYEYSCVLLRFLSKGCVHSSSLRNDILEARKVVASPPSLSPPWCHGSQTYSRPCSSFSPSTRSHSPFGIIFLAILSAQRAGRGAKKWEDSGKGRGGWGCIPGRRQVIAKAWRWEFAGSLWNSGEAHHLWLQGWG